ncbi:aminopeptidase G. Metallo peptidase. MEROPS family M01 [Raineyella antarctica]|uniref:Aminopeptidase N n=1 Tax=Raineyella antarctica TaxID=1577474 RepID=A0A1G6GDC2_9ACTN|nr:aminopeptidase N [Raineyella antarctica]SDB79833.1 aminopeptidase G. Metallo peptidase. MEROPS family M01 [Raineyella antarctica]
MSSANLTRAEAEQRSADIEVHAYDIDLDLAVAPDPGATGFASTTTITFLSAGEDVRLDFIGEAVLAVMVNGQDRDLDGLWDGSALHLTGLLPNRTNRVQVRAIAAYSRTGQGLHRFVDPVDGETYVYSHLEPADARRVFATFEQPDLKASMILHVTAPVGWSVVANQEVGSQVPVGDTALRTTFHPTPPLSTYLVAVCAGPWHHVHDLWSQRSETSPLEVPLGLWCRASLAEYLDAEELFATTRKGLDLFHDLFGFPYPWGKYDQLFAPEYNIGAMENPGCITFNEKYLFTSRPTRQELAQRAGTILHEMSHLWFGDLVTPAWWDDLWLKESFAEYMGTRAEREVGFDEAWVAFAGARKEWAASADLMPTTHPIAADIPDLEAARQNFDGITYAKGAAVLRQLVAYVGEDAFFAGARLYFTRHAFGSAQLVDLLDALEATSGRNLRAWAEQWLQTAGVDELEVVGPEPGAGPGVLRLERTSPDAARRPHRIAVGLYLPDGDGHLARVRRSELDLSGDGAVVDLSLDPLGAELRGGGPAAADVWARPHLLLPNDDDLTYALTRLDPTSRATALAGAGGMVDPLAQAQVWSALWNDVREARLPAAAYLRAVLDHGGRLDSRDEESATTVLPRLVACVGTGIADYLPEVLRAPAWADAFDGAWRRLGAARPGSDQQLAWARAVVRFGGQVGSADADVVAAGLRSLVQEPGLAGLEVGPELRWGALVALAALDRVDDEELDRALAADPTAAARAHRLTARVARPGIETKQWAWDELHRSPAVWSNEEISAALAGFAVASQRELLTGFTPGYWAGLEQVWGRFPNEIAARLVSGLFPAVNEVDPDRPAAEHEVPAAARDWLATRSAAPAALRRLVVEQADAAERAIRAQQGVLALLAGEKG